METTRIGDFDTSRLALGAWAIGGGDWWGDNDDEESIRAIRAAVDGGVTLIDTAPGYGYGHSEEVVGRALEGIRDKVRISTKCGLRWDTEDGAYFFESGGKTVRRNLSPASINFELEQSLRRLRTDHIDVYITHWQSVPEYPTPVEETMGALLKLKAEGKILGIGVSNSTPEILLEYLKYGPVDLIQDKYSILSRDNYDIFADVIKANDVVFQAYSPLESGLLTGKIKPDYIPAPGSARSGNPWFTPGNLAAACEMLDSWTEIAGKYGATKGQLAIAWTLARGDRFSALFGTRTVSQALDNVKGSAIALTGEDLAFIDASAKAAIAKFV